MGISKSELFREPNIPLLRSLAPNPSLLRLFCFYLFVFNIGRADTEIRYLRENKLYTVVSLTTCQEKYICEKKNLSMNHNKFIKFENKVIVIECAILDLTLCTVSDTKAVVNGLCLSQVIDGVVNRTGRLVCMRGQ